MGKVIVMQAVSGAGKSTWIKTNYPDAGQHGSERTVVSADFFFETDYGVYEFDFTKLSDAHGKCFRDFVEYVQRGHHELIIVDNTNTTVSELAPYCAAALAYGHELEIVTLRCDPVVAAKRNTHGVPESSVHAMHNRMIEHIALIPPYWPRVEYNTTNTT